MDAHSFSPERPRPLVAPAQVIALGLVAASIGWSIWLLRDRPTAEEVELLSGTKLPSSELAIIEAAFDRAQLTDYRSEDGRVWVPRARQSAFMRALVDAEALPREFGGSLRRALENNSPWQSKAVQAEMLRVATQDELALVICSMPGIERAAVLYDVDTGGGGLRGSPIKTASVSIRTQADADLDPARVDAIRVLVASSIAGLTPDRVAVTDLRNGRVHAGPLGESETLAEVDPLLARRAAHEHHIAEKIRRALSFVKGATVDVAVEFVSAADQNDAVDSRPQPPEPGVAAQPVAAANAPAELARETPAPRRVETAAPVDGLASVRVAVAVPESYLAGIVAAAAMPPDAFEQERERIRRHVLALLPATNDPDGCTVIVTTFPAVAERQGVAIQSKSPERSAATVIEPAAAATAGATPAEEATANEVFKKLVEAVGRRFSGAEPITREEWLAGISLTVGLLAGWLWWFGARRRGAGYPAIDWSRIAPRGSEIDQEPVADKEPLHRAAA